VGFEVAMMPAVGGWKVEQLEWRYNFPLHQPYLEFFFKRRIP